MSKRTRDDGVEVGKPSDKGWDNPRDSKNDEVQHDTTRLTQQERYGVTYGNGRK